MLPDAVYRKEINPYIERHLEDLGKRHPDLDPHLIGDLRASMQMVAGYAAAAGYEVGRRITSNQRKRRLQKAQEA